MAARRLLIVMLVLLGISTLAAALVPQHALRSPNATTSTTTTRPAPTTTTASGPSPSFLPPTPITVGGKKVPFPVVSPLHVGDQISLQVRSRFPTQLSIPAFGLVGFATMQAPAMFELIADQPGTFGILFEPSGRVAAQVRVVPPKNPKAKKKAKGR